MTTLTPDEVEVARRNLIAVMKAAIRSDDLGATHGVVLNPDEASDLVALLEALKPVVVDRAVTDEDVEDFCREAWAKFYDWDERAQAAFRRTARRALEMPLSQPVVVDREAVVRAIDEAGEMTVGGTNWPLDRQNVQEIADAVLAALDPKATEGES